MKMYKLLLPLLVGALAVLGVLAVLSPDRAVADVLREWDGNWYWKDGGWTDYAPSGVPDFDQKQPGWDNPPGSLNWTYCGPVAAANSLWWFDSKFEPNPVGPPGGPPSTIPYNDNYYLLTSYTGLDDHDPQNVIPFVSDLACYFDTDGIRTGGGHQGTEVHEMAYGLQQYLYNDPTHHCSITGRSNGGSYYDDYHVQLVKMPTFEWVEEEVERSEDVILLLGFWQDYNPSGPIHEWKRLGGHYVTVPGINSAELKIAFSDPFFDNAEVGGAGFGRVLSGTLISHIPTPGHPVTTHNDAGNVSHDYYSITTTVTSPHGKWEILGYLDPMVSLPSFVRQNCPSEFKGDEGDWIPGSPIFVEVEYAIAVSPFHWKPGGEWVDTWWHDRWITEWWWYKDDGDSCLPDFSWGITETWKAYDGPAAVANSLWWFDSKAETLVTGGWPITPELGISDHYNLVGSYGEWDDHAISNTVPFIDDLAQNYLNTNSVISGTSCEDMAAGIAAYLAARGVADDFYTKTQESPSFEWIADEVETCEDVILLLGFYEHFGDHWDRKGGHWANVAGVNRPGKFIGLSDPAINNAISPTLGLGRVFPPEHIVTPFGEDEQKEPQKISHDIYPITTSTDFEGQWVLPNYPVTSTLVLTDFIRLNGEGTDVENWGNPFATVVEWAIGVSPYSDLVLTKTAVVTDVVPGDRITYTLEYANTGLAAANHVTITDRLSLDYLTNITCTSHPPLSATPAVTYVWTLNRMSYGQSGTITITADSRVTATLTNTATITGLNAIGGPTPDRNPNNNTSATCTPVDVTAVDYAPSTPRTGQTVYFTATASGSSPITYTWDFGDNTTGSGVTTQHDYGQAGSYTVWVTATNPCGQDSTSAVVFVREHGVDLQPDSASLTDNPDKTITHTLTLRNTGNVADTYDITGTVSGESWTTTWPTSTGPVAAAKSTQFNVTVQIPSGASDGDLSRATITATSQGDPTKSDTSVLTTTAYAGMITRGVAVAPDAATGNGDPGDTVTYTLRMTNTGNVADTIGLSHTGPSTWTVSYSANPLSLGSGQGTDVKVYVGIPSGAPVGSTGVITVTATSQGDGSKSDDAVLTTTVSWRLLYLPLVMRNYS